MVVILGEALQSISHNVYTCPPSDSSHPWIQGHVLISTYHLDTVPSALRFPPSLEGMTNLQFLELGENSLTGELTSLMNLVCVICPALSSCNPIASLSHSPFLSHSLQSKLRVPEKLVGYERTRAHLTHSHMYAGTLPSDLCVNGTVPLTALYIGRNAFEGSLDLSSCSSLMDADASYNNLTGAIDKCNRLSLVIIV